MVYEFIFVFVTSQVHAELNFSECTIHAQHCAKFFTWITLSHAQSRPVDICKNIFLIIQTGTIKPHNEQSRDGSISTVCLQPRLKPLSQDFPSGLNLAITASRTTEATT